MATVITRKGYGQVEPNHLSVQKTGQISAQLPAMSYDSAESKWVATAQLENGQFLKYNMADGRCDTTSEGEWLMVFCEEKLYDERHQNHKDFVMFATDYTDGYIYPRLVKINVGDWYTTNMLKVAGAGYETTVTGSSVSVGDKLYIQANGMLDTITVEDSPVFKVVKVYTMADSQPGVKIQRIA